MKSLFEQNGGTYTKVGDYYIPNLTVSKCKPIGKYGMLCREYLKNYRRAFYNTLLISGKLNDCVSLVCMSAFRSVVMLTVLPLLSAIISPCKSVR